MTGETHCLGKRLWAKAEKLDQGWDVGLYGGDSTHVGAVTLAAPGEELQTLERSGHRDSALSVSWARQLEELLGQPVCVRCGVHFENFTKADLPAVFEAAQRLLETIERMMMHERDSACLQYFHGSEGIQR